MKINNLESRIIIILTLLLFIIISTSLSSMGKSLSNESKWVRFSKNISCVINSKSKVVNISLKKYPVLEILLKYRGENQFTLKWDSNFGSVLWEGKFILKSKVNQNEETTSELKFRTSNTYEPEKNILLKKGDVLTSVLKFTELPGSYATNLFNNRGKIKLRLYIKNNIKSNLIPVSNELILNVK